MPAELESRNFASPQTFRRILRSLFFVLAVSVLIWGFADPSFRDAEGFPTGRICVPIAIAFSLVALSWAVESPWRKFALWFSLLLMGQAVALQFIDAGNMIRYQHYKPWERAFVEPQHFLWVVLFSQTVLVAAGIARRWSIIWYWIRHHVKVWKLIGVALVFVLSSTALSRQVSDYISELCFATFLQLVNLGNVILLAWAFPKDKLERVRQWLRKFEGADEDTITSRPKYIDTFVVIAALWVTTLAAFLSYFSYERHPHIPDEVVYLQHARYLSAGLLSLPPPPIPEAFHVYLMEHEQGRWFAVPPVGWPALLAIGVLIGVPWLINPLLAGLNIILAYALARELFTQSIARWVVLLLCVSPWYIFMSMNFMTHTFMLTCALSATLAVTWGRQTQKVRWMLIAGAAIGVGSLIRPLEGLILAVLLGLWSLGFGARRLKLPSIAALIFATIAVGAVVLPYNKLLTGDILANPLMVYTDKYYGTGSNALGFGESRGLGWALDPYPGHGLMDVAVNTNLNLFSLNIELFGWSIGSLLLISILLFSRSLRRSDRLMLAVVVAVFGAHIFYWFSGGPDFGARYWYLMLVPLVVFTAKGIKRLEAILRTGSASQQRARVSIAVFSLCAISLINYFPWRAVDKYHHYLRMRPDVRDLATEFDFGKSLVLIRGNAHPDYASAFVYNPLNLQADAPVYAWDRDAATTRRVLEAYQDRPVWILDGPSRTHRGFEVVHSRLSAQVLLGEDMIQQ